MNAPRYSLRRADAGFGIIEVLLILVVVVVLGAVGWYVWTRERKTTASNSNNISQNNGTKMTTTTPTPKPDPYAGWKDATSPRAKFSLKYPANWSYNVAIGDKDNVEHMVLSGAHLTIKIDSFIGKDPANGGNPNVTCPDCQQTVSSTTFDAPKLGKLQLDTVRYTLDSGLGNALILRQSNGTYLISSPDASSVHTSFRGVSILNSLQDYQNETAAQFTSNADYATAQQILKSVTY